MIPSDASHDRTLPSAPPDSSTVPSLHRQRPRTPMCAMEPFGCTYLGPAACAATDLIALALSTSTRYNCTCLHHSSKVKMCVGFTCLH
eukprot:366209-Chlamydomonas_euryale.AAC.11